MVAIKADTRTRTDMKAGAPGEWKIKAAPVKSKRARKAAVADAPKRKFVEIDGQRREVHQARPREARPYPSAPVNARPGSNVAATVMRDYSPHIPHLPFRRIGPELPVGRPLSKREQSNHLPFVPEFQAEGQPYPRTARDKDGNVTPRVRTDNGMTKQLEGRGIARRADGESTYTKRQEAKRAEYGVGKPRAASREEYEHHQKQAREVLKNKINDALARERAALARGDVAAAESYRAEVRALRKSARTQA